MAHPKRTRGSKKPRWGLPPLEGEPQRKALPEVADYDKLMKEALACLQIQSDADRDRAIGEIEFAIAVYLEISSLDENAPRPADLKVTLGDIKRLAGRLASALSVADYHSLRLLNEHGALRLLNEQGGLPLESLDQSLHRPEFDALCHGKGSKLIEYLRELETGAKNAADHVPDDKGGPRKLHLFRPPMDELVAWCWSTFESFSQDKPSTTVEGKLHQFVSLVYNMATGDEAGDLTGRIKAHRIRRQNRPGKP